MIARTRPIVLAVKLLSGTIVALALIELSYIYLSKDGGGVIGIFTPQTVAAVAAVLATWGWLLNTWVQDRNSRRQHTVNILFQTVFTNETFSKHRRVFEEKFPDWHEAEVLTRTGFYSLKHSENKDDRDVAYSVQYILNYFEYIAISIRFGDLDYKIFGETMDVIFCKYHDACRPLICHEENLKSGIMENYRMVYQFYKK